MDTCLLCEHPAAYELLTFIADETGSPLQVEPDDDIVAIEHVLDVRCENPRCGSHYRLSERSTRSFASAQPGHLGRRDGRRRQLERQHAAGVEVPVFR